MEIVRSVVVFDAAEVATESAFWAGVLGGRVVGDEQFHCVVDADGRWRIGVQLAPNHVRPEWPDGSQQQQVHLDLHVVDAVGAHDVLMSLGAEVLQAASDLTSESGHQVYADPAGHPFCIGWGHPSDDEVRAIIAKS